MMDHARHLSSPSPTSPFLFHHSERSFKSNPLTPLLSSAVESDVTSVDDCFSTSSSNNISHQSHNPFGLDNHSHHPHHHPSHHSLVDTHHHHQHHHHHHHSHNGQQNHHQHHNHDQCAIDQDSLTGVDDDDGMHNMLSGSSTSSNSTMPLLTGSHSHHSFSRISLEEYSPLSLVEDCDNALPISPTSLACGSHHSFKTSLNGLKIDNLVGDVGVHDHEVNNVDDVNDARSLSPSLLSSITNNHHNLWSTSSTAISQNTSLLNSTSTSFLLSHHQHHHHQQQLNSLIQQLEPQSLDEAPPLFGNNNNNSFASTGLSSYDLAYPMAVINRPSSEPPAGSACGPKVQDPECKSLINQPLQPKSKQTKPTLNSNCSNSNSNSSNSGLGTGSDCTIIVLQKDESDSPPLPTPSTTKPHRSRARSTKQQQQQQPQPDKKKAAKNEALVDVSGQSSSTNQEQVHSSKVHLQLNHHKKLQELQQRLFGTSASSNSVATGDNIPDNKALESVSNDSNLSSATISGDNLSGIDSQLVTRIKEEPDSSAHHKEDEPNNITPIDQSKVEVKPKARPSRNRKSRAVKNDTCKPSSSSVSTDSQTCEPKVDKVVTTEKAEPDTTTKTSDCVKLVDLLTTGIDTKSSSNNNVNFAVNTFTTSQANNNNGDNGEKRFQQIQLQVSPSLTVVANGGLIQPISIQQPQQQQQQQQSQQQANGASVITSTGTSFANQILCRPQTVVATTANAQLKGIMSNQELLKNGETILSNWSLQTVNNGNNNGSCNNGNNSIMSGQNGTNNNISNGQTIAIQVICQDGTSLVLPVSSAAGLNAAVSLTSQHQQLQAALANNATNGNQQRNHLPMMSVSNIVQQVNSDNAAANHSPSFSNSQSTSSSITQPSGLAASSPTLAALLDAGPNRAQNDLSGNTANLSSQNFVSTNLLRKIVSGNPNESSKRGELTLQQGSTSNCGGSLVAVCTPNQTTNNGTQQTSDKQQLTISANGNTNNNGGKMVEKRIKLESDGLGNLATTYTLIDPYGLLVPNGSDKAGKRDNQQASASTIASSDNSMATQHQQQQQQQAPPKQSRLAQSTGNREVDPSQPFRCEHCNSTFTRLGNFTRHKKIHTVPTKDGQRFKCDVCSKSFLQRCDLARHLHIHRGTEPHRCNICGKGYIRHSDLVTHQRFHNKEKPFGCPHCTKGFCQRGDLNRHLRSIHLQMKPILCPCCNRKFAKQETLLRHLNVAHRSKPGATTGSTPGASDATISNTAPTNFNMTQNDVKQTTTISVVTNTAVINNNTNNNLAQKSIPVASLQAIQATLCKTPQSVEPFPTSGLKTTKALSSNQDTANLTKSTLA